MHDAEHSAWGTDKGAERLCLSLYEKCLTLDLGITEVPAGEEVNALGSPNTSLAALDRDPGHTEDLKEVHAELIVGASVLAENVLVSRGAAAWQYWECPGQCLSVRAR